MNILTFTFRYFSHPNSNKTSSNCLSHNNPATTGSSMFAPYVRHVVEDVSTRLDILRHSEQSRSVLQSYLSVGRHYITCLSVTIWQSGKDIHYFCCGHLWRRRALFSTDCIRSRVVFKNVTLEYDSTFILLKFGSNSALLTCQMSINVAEWTFCLAALPEWPPFCS